VVAGCLCPEEIGTSRDTTESGFHRILLSGKLDDENGLRTFLEAATIYAEQGLEKAPLRFEVCGASEHQTDVELRHLSTRGIIYYHGNLGNDEFAKTLKEVDVCCALQDPNGRDCRSKTPSKIYEYLGMGKVVVASGLEELGALHSPSLIVLKKLSGRILLGSILEYIKTRQPLPDESAVSYARKHWSTVSVGLVLKELVYETNNALPSI
jgi:hypothetical protein